jgi:hypothetical protein
MIGTIVQDSLYTYNRISGQRSLLGGILDTFLYCREIVLRNGTADYLLLELISLLKGIKR